MHRLGWVLMGALGCGPVAAADNEVDDDDAQEPALDYGRCDDARGFLSDEIDHPDTARFDELLAQAIVDGGHAEAATLVDGRMIETNAVRYCATVRRDADWFAATDYVCFDHADDPQMQAAFADYVASWPARPDALVSLAEVEAAANECFAGIYREYLPCDHRSTFAAFELTYEAERWVSECGLETDVATVDLATGELVTCETRMSYGCDDDTGD